MLTLVNIGNTHTQIASVKSGVLTGRRQRLDTRSLCETPLPVDIAAALKGPTLIASVVPEATRCLQRLVAARPAPTRFLTAAMVREVDLSLVDSASVGADRLANAVAASSEELPVIILDCGTCITTEVVDEKRRFRGGVILPGRKLLRQALHDHTGLLPHVALEATPPPSPLGTTTREAILGGVDLGILGSVERILAETRHILGSPSCRTIAVGGDAAFFCDAMPETLQPGGEDFTLRGLARIATRLFAKTSPECL